MDFGKVVDQVRSKADNSQTTNQKASVKTKNPSDQNDMRKKTVGNDKSTKDSDTSQKDVIDTEAQTVSASEASSDKADSAELENEVSENEIGSAEDISQVADIVEDAAVEIISTLAEQLGVTGEEVVSTLEEMGMQPLELLNSDNIAEFMAAVTGEDSPIGIVTDEDMYASLKEIISLIDEKVGELQNELGIEPDKVSDLLEQLKNFENIQKPVETNTVTQEQIPVEEVDMTDVIPPLQNANENSKVPVVVINETDARAQNTIETSEVEEMQEQVSQEIKSEKSESDKGESKDYNGQQNQMQNFQNSIEELENLAASDKTEGVLHTRDTESILKQLADFIKVQHGKELTQMELQLHPASLGTVHIQLSSRGGSVTAQITAQNETVKNAIETQVVQLKNNLEEQGVKVEAIEVSVASHELERNLEQGNQNQNNSERDNNTTGSTSKHRKISINMNDYESDDEIIEQMQGADDAARIAMEMMAMHGNSMNLYA